MKKVSLLATLVLTFAMCASAQTLITFADLPNGASPSVVPENYAGLHWSGIDSVNSLTWVDSGPGFISGPDVMVAFLGGALCYPNYGGAVNDGAVSKNICSGSISGGLGPNALSTFQVDSAVVASGWINNQVVAIAYRNGVQVGTPQKYNLTTSASKIVFPNWGPITELTFTPGPKGSMVLYTLQMK